MKLLLLGTGGYYGNGQRQTACLMLPEAGIILDAGTALYRIRDHVVTGELSIFLTHAHLDHIIGLTYLLDVLSPELLAKTTIFAEPAKLEAVRAHLFADPLFPIQPPLQFRPIPSEVPLAGGGRLTHFPLKHPGGSIGFRLDWPQTRTSPARSLAYVTDTTAEPNADYIDHIRGVDLLIHEAYFLHDERQWSHTIGHSCAEAVAQVAKSAAVGRLVLVHMSPQLTDDANFTLTATRKIFPNTTLGTDNLALEF